MGTVSPLLAELGRLTLQAGEMAVDARKSLVRELKPDGTVVTNGDRAVEEFLRPILTALVPGSTVWGEEFGHEEPGPGGWWLVDPVDGTTNYAFGAPYWGVSIGLMQDDVLTMGSIALPDLNELYLVEAGQGAFLNGKPMAPIPSGPIRDEQPITTCDRVLRRFSTDVLPGKIRISGAFVVDGTFTAMQRFRGMIGHSEKLYDIAPSVLINRELGADIRYANGDAFIVSDLKADAKIDRPWLIFPRDSGFFL